MRNEIEALLRAVDYVIDRNPCTMNESECECYTHEIQRAAAAVRAELAPKPVPDGELLPCPFCGGRPQIVTYGGDAGSFQGGRFVACMICESASLVCWGDEAADRRIAEAWNRRASLAREPVELSDEQLANIYDEAASECEHDCGHAEPDTNAWVCRECDRMTEPDVRGLRAVARAARGESK